MNKWLLIIFILFLLIACQFSFLYAFSLCKKASMPPPISSSLEGDSNKLINKQKLTYLKDIFIPYLEKKRETMVQMCS